MDVFVYISILIYMPEVLSDGQYSRTIVYNIKMFNIHLYLFLIAKYVKF